MELFKDYLYQMSKIEYQSPYIMVTWQYPPALFKRYIPMILNISFEESNHHAYYGEITKICFSFLHCYSDSVNSTIKHCDRYLHVLSYAEMMDLFNKTVKIHEENHQKVLLDFQPINSEKEQQQLDEIISLHNAYMEELRHLGERLSKIQKPENILKFAKDNFETCLQRINQMGEITRTFIAKFIAMRIHWIRISLEDIMNRIKKNADEFHGKYQQELNNLFQEMYDRNKESLKISQNAGRSSTDTVEIANKIQTLKHKIQGIGNKETFNRLASEMSYWSKHLHDFEEVAAIIKKVKTALDKARQKKELHDRYKTVELPGRRHDCWDTMGHNFDRALEELEKKYIEACIPIFTFFVCKGYDRLTYVDDVGRFYVDEFGHRNYMNQFSAQTYHVKCDGRFFANRENDKYYFDDCGRYIVENDEKIYQLAPCTNKFRMNNQGLLESYVPCACSNECGQVTQLCDAGMHQDVEKSPNVEPVNIEGTLDPETVKYLWEAFGHILPEVVCEVGEMRPKNPLHHIAHALINKKYSMSTNQWQEKKNGAQEYRANIIKERQEKAAVKAREWKAKQSKRCKPEDLDTTPMDQATTSQQIEEQLMYDINEYCYQFERLPAPGAGVYKTDSN